MSFPKSAGEPASTVPPSSAKLRLDLGIGEARIDPLVEPIDNLGGCVPGGADPKHRASLEAWHGIADGGYVGQSL